MADVHDRKTRSYNMSRIRSRDTKPEFIVRKYLHANGFRYRLHVMSLPGRPDLVLPKYKTAIFVHGCFFHGHECHIFKWPANNAGFWKKKIKGNMQRDLRHVQMLRRSGWNVILVWECELRPKVRSKNLAKLPGKISKFALL